MSTITLLLSIGLCTFPQPLQSHTLPLPKKPRWPWMGPIDLVGILHELRLTKILPHLTDLGIESILDLTYITRSDLLRMSMTDTEIHRFTTSQKNILLLSESIQYTYAWPMLHAIEKDNTDLLLSFATQPFYQALAFLDQSLLVVDESKSLDLTELRLLQTMKQLSNEMSRFCITHRLNVSFFQMNVAQVLQALAAAPSITPAPASNVGHINNVVSHVRTSIRLASMGISKLKNDVLTLEGMSSYKVRHLLNNLGAYEKIHYLEVGSWKGASLCSAIYGNEKTMTHAIAIDNFSQFGGTIEVFENTIQSHISSFQAMTVYNQDAFEVDLATLKNRVPIANALSFYFYDGPHDEQDHYNAFMHFNQYFTDVFIVVIDDWNFQETKTGTTRAFEELKYDIIFKQELPAGYNGDVEHWWNGLFVAVIRKVHLVESFKNGSTAGVHTRL